MKNVNEFHQSKTIQESYSFFSLISSLRKLASKASFFSDTTENNTFLYCGMEWLNQRLFLFKQIFWSIIFTFSKKKSKIYIFMRKKLPADIPLLYYRIRSCFISTCLLLKVFWRLKSIRLQECSEKETKII